MTGKKFIISFTDFTRSDFRKFADLQGRQAIMLESQILDLYCNSVDPRCNKKWNETIYKDQSIKRRKCNSKTRLFSFSC